MAITIDKCSWTFAPALSSRKCLTKHRGVSAERATMHTNSIVIIVNRKLIIDWCLISTFYTALFLMLGKCILISWNFYTICEYTHLCLSKCNFLFKTNWITTDAVWELNTVENVWCILNGNSLLLLLLLLSILSSPAESRGQLVAAAEWIGKRNAKCSHRSI